MNQVSELTEVRELFGDPPAPSADVVAAARARLTEDDVRSVRERRPWRLQLGLGLGLVAGATAAVVTVASLGGGANSPSVSVPQEQAAEQHLQARQFLLAAATKLDQTKPSPGTGRYWRQRTVSGRAWPVTSSGQKYVVYTEQLNDAWLGKSQSDGTRFFERPNPTGPQTPEDIAAWRKAGAPTQWRSEDGGEGVRLHAGGDRTESDRPAYIVLNPATTPPSVAERLRSGADPAAFVALARRDAGFVDGSANELMVGSRYLGDKLAVPRSRAAVFRLLASLPGVRSLGMVKDAHGRPGIALAPALISRVDGSVAEYRLVMDPRTYDLLGDQMIVKRPGKSGLRPGMLLDYTYVVSEGWTDEAPPRN